MHVLHTSILKSVIITLGMQEFIREQEGMALNEENIVKNFLRWFGHVRRRPIEAVVKG